MSTTLIKKISRIGTVNIVTKYKYYELLESGIELKDVPEEKRSKPCLREEEALELTKLGIQLEGHFLSPQDFEWVIDKHTRRIYLVQTRPAKNLPPEKTSTEKLLDLMMSRF